MKLIPIYKWNPSEVFKSKNGERITNQPWFQGVLLLLCVLIAMLAANLPATKHLYFGLLETQFTLHVANPDAGINVLFPKDMTIEKLINDILMVIFFFTVGLEIRREISHGELSSPKKALLPVIAALGGVLCPALLYTIINHGTPGATGWGIPTATDIAFAVCILSVLGKKVPVSLKVFLTALAIADDLIAILVVAIFYGGSINIWLVIAALLMVVFGLWLRKKEIKSMLPYLAIALIVWILFYYGGIHATMSGVIMAFVIPSHAKYTKEQTLSMIHEASVALEKYDNLEDEPNFPSGPQRHYMRQMKKAINGSAPMSYNLEYVLSPWVNFLIMPLFALANAGVDLGGSNGLGTVGLGIMAGLILGKPLGITLFSYLAIKLGVGEKPAGSTWPMFFAVACLGGIGFTMSIFVDTLSFTDQAPAIMEGLRASGKIAVLLGSVCAAVLGTILINLVSGLGKKK